jgi:cytochrome c551/c552
VRKFLSLVLALGMLSVGLSYAGGKDVERKLMQLAKKKGCTTCHDLDKPKNSVPYRVIAKEYKGKKDAVETLVKSILYASFGKWQSLGPKKYGMKPRAIYMPRQRQVTENEAREIVKLILSLDTSSVKTK